MNRLLTDLNEPQLEAVTTTEGPLLVIAGAGSGKTRVLTRRLAFILTERKASPWQVLAVTFTNKAAGEMKQRVADLLGEGVMDMNVSTFHSFCARLLRREAGALGYDTAFTIFDQSDSVTLVKNCLKELGLSSTQFAPKAQLSKISHLKNRLITSDAAVASASEYFEKTTAQIYSLYQHRLRECNVMDFDDLLVNSVVLLRDHEDIGRRYRDRFRYLMVDEYQDTNHVQYLLLRQLVGEHHNICVVGDEDQSIYGWRGADIRNILRFEEDFPGARVIKLEQNYRSTTVILDAASAVIQNNEARKGKKLWSAIDGGEKLRLLLVDSAADEALRVADAIDQLRGETRLREMVVLYRTNAQSRAFEEELRRRNVPYQIVGGITFYERKEIKDLLAYFKLIANPKDDVSFARIVNYPRRGVGDRTIETLTAQAREQGCSVYELLLRGRTAPESIERWHKLAPFVELMEKYRERRDATPVDLLAQDLVDEIGLIEELRTEDRIVAQTRIENVEALIEGMAEFAKGNGDATLDNYLAQISLFTDLDTYSGIEDKVTLMTIHAAKGLEYDTVFLVGLEEGLFPLERTISEPMELEEERRLFYVGSTRARRLLYLSTASSRHRFGQVVSMPSRFIKEIPTELIEPVDHRARLSWQQDAKPSRQPYFRQPRNVEPEGVHYEYEGEEAFRVGRIVQHPTFGRGRILATEGFGESLRLQIMFTGIGPKTIMAKYAKLKPVG